VVCKAAKLQSNVAGVPYAQFVVEHRSEQVEADMPRSAYVRIAVIAAGQTLTTETQNLAVGQQVEVHGFLHRHQQANGLAQLVLHADTVYRIS